ncbi:MAG: hypothetical protein ACE5G2_00650 [Candidatus Krumholzibacteriia bacterium]
MRYAMYGLLLGGFVGLVVTSALGLGWIPTDHLLALHWQAAIWTVLLVLSAHTTILFYFLATGKQLRVLMQESGRPVNAEYLADMKLYKAKVFPPLMGALFATMAAFVVGGGVVVGSVPGEVHLGLGILALVANFVAGIREVSYIQRNSRLMCAIEREYLG